MGQDEKLCTARRRSTWPRDDAPQWQTCSAPAPGGIRWSGEHRHSPRDAAAQTAWFDLLNSDRRDIRTNILIRDISGGTDRGYVANPRLRSRDPRESSYVDIRPAPLQFRR